MPKSQIDGTALLAAVVASAFGFSLLGGPYFWMGSIAGLSIACIVLGFDREGVRSVLESLGFAAVVGLAFALATAVPISWLRHNPQNGAFGLPILGDWLPFVWIGLTILIALIDQARMSGRVQYAPVVQPQASFSFRPTAAPVPVPEPARVVVPEPPPSPSPTTPRPTFTRPSFSEVAAEPLPVSEPPRAVERFPEPVAGPPVPVASPMAQAAPAQPATPPLPQAVPIPPGKEATIYVMLVGEGLNVLRAVRAEHVGRDFYRIAEPMPDGETWQFGPGQIVRCRKKNLSSGKAMVAVEEAPRAQ
jgi:hypothetical protein